FDDGLRRSGDYGLSGQPRTLPPRRAAGSSARNRFTDPFLRDLLIESFGAVHAGDADDRNVVHGIACSGDLPPTALGARTNNGTAGGGWPSDDDIDTGQIRGMADGGFIGVHRLRGCETGL